jgi:hypothetical protein
VEDVVPEHFDSPTASPAVAKSDPTYRLAKATAIGLGVAILVAIVVIIYGISAGWGHKSTPAAATPAKKPISMTLAPGYRILSSDTQPGRLILHVRSTTDDEIWVLNTDDGSVVARIHGEAPK